MFMISNVPTPWLQTAHLKDTPYNDLWNIDPFPRGNVLHHTDIYIYIYVCVCVCVSQLSCLIIMVLSNGEQKELERVLG